MQPFDEVACLGAVVDATARCARQNHARPVLSDFLEATVQETPRPTRPGDVDELRDRLQDDDPHVRAAAAKALRDGLSTSQEGVWPTENGDDERPWVTKYAARSLLEPLLEHVTSEQGDGGFAYPTVAVLSTFLDNGWLDDDGLDAVATTALAILEADPSDATPLLTHPALARRLSREDAQYVLDTYADSLRNAPRGEDEVIIATTPQVPDDTLDVIETLLDTGAVPPDTALDAIPLASFEQSDAPSLDVYLGRGNPDGVRLLSLLTAAATATDRSLDALATPLARALATKSFDDTTRLDLLDELTRLDADAHPRRE